MFDQSTDSPEEWRPVVGWEGWYEVSDLGRVRNVARRHGTQAGHILKPSLNKDGGYWQVGLWRHGHSTTHRVHRLVAFAFLGAPPHATDETNHKDGIKTNARRSNLEWVTPLGNKRHAVATGLSVRGEIQWAAKLTEADVRAIRLLRGTMTEAAIGAQFGVSRRTVHAIDKGENWTHVL